MDCTTIPERFSHAKCYVFDDLTSGRLKQLHPARLEKEH